jgi:ribose 1,5-bisphosphokinase PhnN
LAGEVAKCLKLVAPSNMGAEQQTVWLHAAVDALEDIRPAEVAAISAELRRSVTRPAQIVPEIARLVHEKRQRSNVTGDGKMTALEYAQRAKEYGLPKHYEAWMQEARLRGEIQ